MSNIAKAFKEEVIRLARKEAKMAVTPIRKPAVAIRKAVADLKRRVATLENENKRLSALLAKVPQPQAEPAVGQKARITGKGMRSLRRSLRLSGQQLGRLLGVTAKAVYLWEAKNGPLRVRETTKAAILSVRDLGAREARQRLEGMAKVAKRGRSQKSRR